MFSSLIFQPDYHEGVAEGQRIHDTPVHLRPLQGVAIRNQESFYQHCCSSSPLPFLSQMQQTLGAVLLPVWTHKSSMPVIPETQEAEARGL